MRTGGWHNAQYKLVEGTPSLGDLLVVEVGIVLEQPPEASYGQQRIRGEK